MEYLRSEQYYSELYDRITIEECERWVTLCEKGKSVFESSDLRKKEMKEQLVEKLVTPIALHFIKGERYVKKGEMIRVWIARDRTRDARLAEARAPVGVRCYECSRPMDCISRDLMQDKDDTERALFLFECSSAGHKGRAYWENGEEWEPKPYLCAKCRSAMESTRKREGDIITTTYACQCGYSETDTMDLNEKEEVDPDFEKKRKKYCLSEKEGGEYISAKQRLESVVEHMKGAEKNKEAREKIGKIRKLTVVQLENLLAPACEKNGYLKFELAIPEMGRVVVAGFTARESKPDRDEYDSKDQLKNLIHDLLADTNWRLMSDGLHFRLGVLQGRLKAYEREEDLVKLV